jgi:hypothetical protein
VLEGPLEREVFDEWGCAHWIEATTGDEPYQFYNVMWTETKDTISYRVAVGRIVRESWERVATEWVDVTLR